MCGIAGIFSVEPGKEKMVRLKRMTDALVHRGPDGEGHWISPDGRVALGHRMLIIQDAASGASQPMLLKDRYVVTYNGEIYNFPALRRRLEQHGYVFSTTSDTEVLLACYDWYGPAEFLQHLDGMFAFALYDRLEQQLFLARDRFGEKPLYYNYEPGKHFLFGSEMKALWAAGVAKIVNPRLLHAYLAEGIVSNPDDPSETFYKGCTALPAGHFATIDTRDGRFNVRPYFDIDPDRIDATLTAEAAVAQFRELFESSVAARTLAAPGIGFGASLSGGLDSSVVVAELHRASLYGHEPLRTFSAVFSGYARDERQYIDRVTAVTAVLPHFITPSGADLADDFCKLAYHQEEPFGGPSIYLQYKVMQAAREAGTRVLFNGDGADETLAGYETFFANHLSELQRHRHGMYATERRRFIELLAASGRSLSGAMRLRLQLMAYPSGMVRARRLRNWMLSTLYPVFSPEFAASSRMQWDASAYDARSLNTALYFSTRKLGLQNELRISDRNSMAHGIEARLPFLAHQLVSFLFTLPASLKIRDGHTKWIVRKAYEQQLPAAIVWRRGKVGYEPPTVEWMQSPGINALAEAGFQKLAHDGILSRSFKQAGFDGIYDRIYSIKWRLASLVHVLAD